MQLKLNIKNWRPENIVKSGRALTAFVVSNAVFIGMLYLYVVRETLEFLLRIKLIGKLFKLMQFDRLIKLVTRIMMLFDIDKKDQVSRSYLIELAFRNMKARKTRSTVTIGGVALGVGAIVFLVSMGYGLEKMVISKVARLEELKMADVSSGKVSSAKMNEELLNKIKGYEGVMDVVPMVSMVAKVTYNNSVLDVMTYAIDERYIKALGLTYLAGSNFKDNTGGPIPELEAQVKGASQEVNWALMGEKAEQGMLKFNIAEGKKAMVWERCEPDSRMMGTVIRVEGGLVGEEVWGEKMFSAENEPEVGKNIYTDEEYSKWIKAKVPLWKIGEEGEAIPVLSDGGRQVWEVGCLLPESVVIDEKSREEFVSESLDEYLDGLGLMAGEVMGVTTSATTVAGPVRLTASSSTASASLAADTEVASASAMLFETVVATDSSGIEWVELKKVEEDKNKVEKISYRGSPVAEAYISSGMVKLLGLSATEAVGKVFKIYYIVPDSLMSGKTGRMQSEEAEYTVSGVIEDQNSSYFYYQISDAKRLGVSNYSQIKVVAQNEETLLVIRKAIETLGFRTTSTADTVAGIEKIFASLRLVLGFLGTIALAVASLGMFNTMTVSLLERTREVGVMKAMGMLSEEVRELFLAESMIMGVGGGTFGVVFGFVTGKLISFVLTTISVMKGQGTMDISYVPWFFVAFIMLVSFVVGILTGWYPSKRARAISALNALRYE